MPGDTNPDNNESSATTTIPGKDNGGGENKPTDPAVPVPVMENGFLLLMSLILAGLAAIRLNRRH